MSARWAKLETHVVNGVFPLQRCIGSTEHSGVFLTQSAQHAAVALKLIPVITKSAEAQLARWRVATRLTHPHLLQIFQVGVCRVDGTHYLYVLMEYADQTLAQVLEGRALGEGEAREMLVPMLDALQCLHRANVAHAALKPSNVLVVGDQLKLASDTMRVIGMSGAGASIEGDVCALGATLCEALTRIRPTCRDDTGHVELPATLPTAFREVISRCLSQDQRDRPTVASLEGWLRGESLARNPPAPTPAPQPDNTVELPSRVPLEFAVTSERTSRRALPWLFGALGLVVMFWMAYRWIRSESPRSQSTPPPVVTPSPNPAALAPVEPFPTQPEASAGIAIDEVMPAVSQSALDTVRGILRVTVLVSVNKAGTVIAATTDDPGPSRYFERRSLEASRKWTFAPAETTGLRLMRIRFAFTRSGVTANLSPLP
ncbi:MAG: TonB family protein [Steroidobacteraceae bacterium]